MGIVKVGSGEPARKSGYSCGDDELTQGEMTLLQRFPNECEHEAMGCELAISGGQICTAPYDLYDLPDLTEVLSLETWNLCLTEDDRFFLAAYLPDMDQHNFFLTMNELLSGSSMFFGSPLGSFFDRLNGGFYSPQVSQAREGLLFFQRRRYYHSLKSYHDDMIQKLADMERLWRSCELSASLTERVHAWNNWRSNKPLMFVDLNSIPSEDYRITKGGSEAATFSRLKRAKLMDGTVTNHCSAFSTTTISGKQKEAHRAKSVEMDSLENQFLQPPSELCAEFKKLPKGVLQIRTRGASPTHEKERLLLAPVLIPINTLDMHNSRLSISHYATTAQAAHCFDKNSPYPCCINTHGSTSGNSHSSAWKEDDALETGDLSAKRSSAQNMVSGEFKTCNSYDVLKSFHLSAANHSLGYFDETSIIRELPNEKNLLKNFGQQNIAIPESSLDPYSCTTKGHQKKSYMTMCHPKDAESISGMLTLGPSIHPSQAHLPEQLETTHKFQGEVKLKTPPGILSITHVEEGHRFPAAHTRKKAHKKLLVDSVKKSSMVVNLQSQSVTASMPNAKPKAVRIKFKGWSNYVGTLAAANNES